MNESLPLVIVGSGPSGVAAAGALIEAGHRPLLIDSGHVPDPLALARKQAFLEQGAPPTNVQSAAGGDGRNNPGQKAWFSSFDAFTQPPDGHVDYAPNLAVRASYDRGGFSRVWGGTFAFHIDPRVWPQAAIPDEQDLALVRRLVPSSTTSWDLVGQPPQQGRVAGSMLSYDAMRRFVSHDRHGQWRVEPSRVAIDTRPDQPTVCRPCGLCLSGCPHDSIWYSGDTVQRWVREAKVQYASDTLVERIVPTAQSVRIHTRSAGAERVIEAARVYLAAGPIATGAILINSGVRDSLELLDTSTAFVAAMSMRRQTPSPGAHALSQWWVSSADNRFHAQVYAPSTLHVARLEERLPALSRAQAVTTRLAMRLHPVIAYLDPELSDRLTLSRRGGRVHVAGRTSEATTAVFGKYLSRLSRTFAKAGFVLPVRAAEIGEPGAGYHFGSSLPHGTDSDDLGRVAGIDRVHVVDGSVLPHIQVGSITPTIMANACRIARVSVRGDRP